MSAIEPVAVIGRYALHDEIASGGMATVHLGRLLGPVGFARTVAIKRLHHHYAKDPEFVSMFLDEARLAARIRHPNVVPTLDVVALSGELFLVMDYVHGVSLSRLMRTLGEERIPVDVSAAIMVGALHGLHAAHEAHDERGQPLGIVHRDVSPQNVMVGSDGLPRVLDFGVAKASWRIQTTRDGQVKGKLSYMAPEQVNGGSVGPWTDVYAAGIVLWEALANERLFKGDDSGAVLARFTKNEPIEPPSTFNDEISPELDAVVLRSLEADPEKRYASANDFADAIEGATRLASNSTLARWVQSVVHEELAIRSTRITEIEQGSTGSDDDDGHPSVRKMLATISGGEAHRTVTAETYIQPTAEQSSRSQISMTRSPAPSQVPSPGRHRLNEWGGAVTLLAGAIALFFVFTRAHKPAELPASGTTAPSAAPAAVVPPPLPASTAPPAPQVVELDQLPTASPPPRAGVAPPSVRATGASATKAVSPAPAGAPASTPGGCNPPYIVDSRGVRHMKLACLR